MGDRAHRVHRAKALEWLVATDWLLKMSSAAGSWKFYQQVINIEARGLAILWPLIRANMDCDSSQFAALMFLLYELHVNIDVVPDLGNHGLHNDVKLTIGDVHLKGLWMLEPIIFKHIYILYNKHMV